ncbi:MULTISPECIES: FADH(2)-oxidizing methylenetetrahydrofolate--tRNA-(uracil(54)-C(5))-methyltransferase TrmFO [Bacillus]|jgi:methylenetetrahydrofolate--tRNA-(uracil-5-)-methyltransferase|uniref:Methylenetetrahydrofolate--tRNA-(uracil-5-)-methyltransferase TrmFO n=1 Tax=Bacillus spizizenii (strain DSM 15029 / JCM 12233 / NBRC 101239 / NRRL B-23049 / TU-B-10) TaxID=1052585 RepID=G4NSM2_BACS4|nr:FADH(2)-oxidizing methylenetetrahydrofolate--tRNA-(uracil(54)-C(5))-methyltransferase TrmFO [Bacillus spizizenii]APH68511.1 methylenetetrahydrofolate--tRNA-(uracil(54)-C(5))-methyltransferase (FADH(2)-oxidizing) TrmFO [Bacillus subtilis]CUB21840.1 Methylenetetrahydrofolate--tRNA-(uracil-5-)-methyltransferase TrmFO [Bacillus cereus]AEP86602.1 gid protein [Bacillus spizizenii TU-B-10]MBK4202947.1 FADH(2)-oxidizing methylenetetrahydrofolate--tRNA-(uracil(54)-C(5))-methyltransferase TrmFO [Bacil
MNQQTVNVIGAGLAGSEAAWQLAKRGIQVRLYEMRPVKQTPAHHTDKFAELVCSNSLRSNTLANAVGVLKEEMRALDSAIIAAADECSVPAGGALAVDRHEFAASVTNRVKNHPNVTVINEEVTGIPEGPTIIATGPLTSESLSAQLKELTGEDYLYFYDAAAPIVEKDSLDMDKVYLKSRYDKGEAAYLNCPMTEEEFDRFHEALTSAETVPLKEFEKEIFFEGCMPIEVMAKRGKKTMLFGPMKPVGLEHPVTGKRPHAVVQLRQDDAAGTLYNIVGFQTHLKWGDQKEVLKLIPGLENVEIVRYGVMHRNTFINSPSLLKPTYQFKNRSDLFFAGQMTGVEGYVESAASGLVAGINAAKLVLGEELVTFPQETTIGSMAHYITTTNQKNFQPMNANFGLLKELPVKIKNKKERNEQYANRAIETIQTISKTI